MPKYANASNAYVISDRSGFRYRTKDTRKEWIGLLVGLTLSAFLVLLRFEVKIKSLIKKSLQKDLNK